jgi:hypothetical protein
MISDKKRMLSRKRQNHDDVAERNHRQACILYVRCTSSPRTDFQDQPQYPHPSPIPAEQNGLACL